MIKSNKILLFIGFLVLLQASLIFPASKLKQYWKPAMALGTAAWAGYDTYRDIQIGRDQELSRLKSLPDHDEVSAAYIKEIFAYYVSGQKTPFLLDTIKFKRLERDTSGDAYSFKHKGERFILVTDCAPDFALLHELGHLYHRHKDKQLGYAALSSAVATGLPLYYFLTSTAKKRFILAPFIFGCNLLLGQNFRLSFGRFGEIQADDFALECLKKKKNIPALEEAVQYYNWAVSVEDQEKPDLMHPSASSRLAKVEQVIKDLKAQESREIKE